MQIQFKLGLNYSLYEAMSPAEKAAWQATLTAELISAMNVSAKAQGLSLKNNSIVILGVSSGSTVVLFAFVEAAGQPTVTTMAQDFVSLVTNTSSSLYSGNITGSTVSTYIPAVNGDWMSSSMFQSSQA